MIIYSLNTYIQNDTTLQGLMGGPFIIPPFTGEEPTVAPIIVYEWRPDIVSNDMFMLSNDIVIYTVADINIDRAFSIRKRIIELMNVANKISTVVDSGSQFSWSFLRRSYDKVPMKKDGYYEFSCLFQVGYKSLS